MSSSIPVNPLRDASLIARLIGEVTHRPEHEVYERLRGEYRAPGRTVLLDLQKRNVTPHMPSRAMAAFYSESDAFLYESAVWNRNRLKLRMRRWVCERLSDYRARPGCDTLTVLVVGDGPGFDSLEVARTGNEVTYYDLPGCQEVFAHKLFARCAQPIRILTERGSVPEHAFDALVCLDVLEHVDDPPALVRVLAQYLKPHGLLFAHAPFYMIHPAYPTHLRTNRRYSGSLALYRDAGFRLIDAAYGWNPLLFQRASAETAKQVQPMCVMKRVMIHITGAYFALGRLSAYPLYPAHWLRVLHGEWFG